MDVAVVSILAGLSYGVVLFLVAAGLSFVLGLMVERGLQRKLYKLQLEQILVTFGFVYIIANVHLWVYGAWPQAAFVPPGLSGSVTIGQFSFAVFRLVIIAIGVLLCPVLWYIQDRTRIGAIIRAGMDDPDMASVMGINLRPINIAVFFLAACLAGFAGVIGASPLGGVNLNLGQEMIFMAIAVVVVGGVGSIQGALTGALLIGVTSALAGTYFLRLAIFVPYILMLIILIFRPRGLLGRR